MSQPSYFEIQSLASSNMPKPEKSALLRHIDKLTGGAVSKFLGETPSSGTIEKVPSVMETGLSLLVDDTESAAFGAAIRFAEGADPGSLGPAAAAMAAGAAAALLGRGSWMETAGKNLSASGSTLLGYHSLNAFVFEKKRAASILAGDFSGNGAGGEDPIVACAKECE